MLLELKISNFAIIENIHIEFRNGLNILSGETGAGKSVLLKSLALLMGTKSAADMVRTGSQQAVIEGFFDLQNRQDLIEKLHEMGIDTDENQLIVRRIVSAQDKSKIYLNGSLSNLNHLRDIVAPLIEVAGPNAPLIEMTGQHENRNLLSRSYHLDVLDQFASTWELRQTVTEKYTRWSRIQNEIIALEGESQLKAQRLDFLIFQRDEIAAMDLSPGEDHQLENDVRRLKNLSRLAQFVEMAERALYEDDDSANARIETILKKGHEIKNLDSELGQKVIQLEQAKELIDSCIYDLRNHLDKMDADPEKLEQLEQRLSDLRKLQKKYGHSVDEILKSLLDIETEIGKIQNSESQIESKKKELAILALELKRLSEDLHERRFKTSKKLATAVNSELAELNMKGVTFHVQIEKLETLQSTGCSEVEFMSQTSAKDVKRPLAKFASGGELSRILLSLKKVVGTGKFSRTYLFDEVDAGVSGETAEKVGKKLKVISEGQQVICVTHLPQVAAFGDVHFYIEKSPQKGSVAMLVTEVCDQRRIEELARLISGEKITATSLAHAKELLEFQQR